MNLKNNPITTLWRAFKAAFSENVSRDIAMMNIGQQVLSALDVINQQIAIGPPPEGDANGDWQEDPNLMHWLQDLYTADDGSLYAITVSNGKLYRWPITVDINTNTVSLGDPTEVKPVFATAKPNSLKIQKRTDGRYAGFAVLGTAALNKDGEIDSRDLFDCFESRFNGTREYVNIYHLGGDVTRIGELDLVFREGNLLVGHYVLDDNPVAKAVGETLAADDKGEWGGSIEFLSDDEGSEVEVAPGVRANVYTSGTLRGFSIATCADGAAWGTAHLMTRTPDMNDLIKAKVKKLLNNSEEAFTMLEGWLEEGNVRTTGAITRTTETQVAGTPVTQEATPVEDAAAAGDTSGSNPTATDSAGDQIVVDDKLLGAITQALLDSDAWKAQATAMDDLTSRVSAIEQSVADLQTAASGAAAATQTSADQVQALATDVAGRVQTIEQTVDQLRGFYERNKPASVQTATYRPGTSVTVQTTAVKPAPVLAAPPTLASQWKRPEKVFGPKRA